MKLSIITINYNNADGLQKTINSVLAQSFTDWEYIIIDGGSTDQSVEVIKTHQQHIACWVSEKDSGVYNAMNKGIAAAKGEYLLMLNSGDYLINNEVLSQVFGKPVSADILYGDTLWDDNGSTFETHFPEQLSFQYFRNNSLGHQTTFIRRGLHNEVGMYDESYRIVSDWKFFMQAICKHNVSCQHIPVLIAVCGRDGLSCKIENWGRVVAEREAILNKEYAMFMPDYERADTIEQKYDFLNKSLPVRIGRRIKMLK
ncbi:glycosyltransferase family 2 protein [Mucilaginibacter terrae]|uniref:glycosyltransferase family 2 protein n=1 Tax=Mucilaginibacter terrae TaxID=1955052 RepID=UPI003639E036